MSRLRLWSLDVECTNNKCDHRPHVRLTAEGRNAWAVLPERTVVADVTCARQGCGTSYPITARAVRDGKEVRGLVLVAAEVVELPDICPAGPHLSPRETEVCAKLLEGKTHARIGRELGISVWTVRAHLEGAAERMRAWDSGLCGATAARTVLAFHNARQVA